MPGPPLVDFVRAQFDRKHLRYTMVSAVAVGVSTSVLVFCKELLNFSPELSNLVGVSVGCIPSYMLNRSWVWGKRGKSHFWREVMPFWALALLGLILSTLAVYFVSSWNDTTLVTLITNLSAFGILWVAKFMILDSLLFKVADELATA